MAASHSSQNKIEEHKGSPIRKSIKVTTLQMNQLSRGWDSRSKMSESSGEGGSTKFNSARLSKRDQAESEREEKARRRKERLI